jgi:hypothetical protein
MACVVFAVGAEAAAGPLPVPNEEVARLQRPTRTCSSSRRRSSPSSARPGDATKHPTPSRIGMAIDRQQSSCSARVLAEWPPKWGVEALGDKTLRCADQPGLNQQLLELGHRHSVQTHENRRGLVEVRALRNTRRRPRHVRHLGQSTDDAADRVEVFRARRAWARCPRSNVGRRRSDGPCRLPGSPHGTPNHGIPRPKQGSGVLS